MKKILLIKSVDPSFDAYQWILESWGFETKMILVKGPREEVRSTIETWAPDMILLNNSDLFSECFREDADDVISLFEKLSVPVVLWDYEGPTFSGGSKLIFRYLNDQFFRNFLYFAIDSEVALDYRRRGFKSFYLPFGVDPRLADYRVPEFLKNSFKHDMTYIGTAPAAPTFPDQNSLKPSMRDYFLNLVASDIRSMMKSILRVSDIDSLLNRVHLKMDPVLDALLKADIEDPYRFSEEEVRFSSLYVDRIAEEISNLDSARDQLRTVVGLRLRLGYSFYQLTDRIDRLIPEGIKVYGEGDWNRILLKYANPIRRLSYPEMFAAFHNSKLVFSYTKKLFLSSVHERVFHVLGAGGCPLIDRRADLELLFEKDEVPAYQSFEELQSLSRFLIKNDSFRMKIVEKGRKKVFSSHSYAHRLADLLWAVCKETGKSMPSLKPLSMTATHDWIEAMYHPKKILNSDIGN